MTYSSICVAVALQRYLDFTPVALRQRHLAALIASACRARLTVVTVEAPVELLPGLETMQEKLDRYTRPLQEQGLDVTAHHREGKPSSEILATLDEVDADLLIMGSHSKRTPLDVGLGSTVRALPSDLAVPVLLIRPTHEEYERTQELKIPKYPVVFPYG